jgi:hypothetical protein
MKREEAREAGGSEAGRREGLGPFGVRYGSVVVYSRGSLLSMRLTAGEPKKKDRRRTPVLLLLKLPAASCRESSILREDHLS